MRVGESLHRRAGLRLRLAQLIHLLVHFVDGALLPLDLVAQGGYAALMLHVASSGIQS